MIDLAAPIQSWMPTHWYAGYLAGLPDLCVGRWPSGIGRDKGNDRFKIWFVETAEEGIALREALAKPAPRKGSALDFSFGPDRIVSARGTASPFVALYAPAVEGWPWVTVVCVEPSIGATIGAGRGIYTWDADDIEGTAIARMARLRAMYGNDVPVHAPPQPESKN